MTLSLFLYILSVAIAILAGVAVYGGIGLLARRIIGLRVLDLDGLSEAPIVGWCLALAALQIWHIVFPVNTVALVLVVCAGLCGLWVARGAIRQALSAGPSSGRRAFAAVVVLSIAWLASHTTSYPKLFDSGLYHVTNVKWVYTYPVVPGLSNLSREFGHNCAYFLYAALLDVGPFADRFHHLASGILIAAAIFRICISGWQLFAGTDHTKPKHFFDVIFVSLLVYLTVGEYGFGSTPSPDLALYVLGFMAATMLLSLLSVGGIVKAGAGAESEQALSWRFISIALLAGTGVAIKLSSIGLFGAISVLIAVVFVLRARATKRFNRVAAIGVATIAFLIFVPWTARSIILSGYVGYPSTVLAAPVEWKVPEADAKAYVIRARAESRQFTGEHERVLSDWKWFGPWLRRMLGPPFDFEMVAPLALAFLAAPLIYLSVREREGQGPPATVKWIMAVPIFNLMYWFAMAPDPRHAGVTFWFAAGASLTLALWSVNARALRATATTIVLILVLMSVKLPNLVLEWRRNTGPIKHKRLETRTTRSGLEVYVPVGDFRVWNAPLPCTPYFDLRLRARVPGDLSRGFVLDQAPPGRTGDRSRDYGSDHDGDQTSLNP